MGFLLIVLFLTCIFQSGLMLNPATAADKRLELQFKTRRLGTESFPGTDQRHHAQRSHRTRLTGRGLSRAAAEIAGHTQPSTASDPWADPISSRVRPAVTVRVWWYGATMVDSSCRPFQTGGGPGRVRSKPQSQIAQGHRLLNDTRLVSAARGQILRLLVLRLSPAFYKSYPSGRLVTRQTQPGSTCSLLRCAKCSVSTEYCQR